MLSHALARSTKNPLGAPEGHRGAPPTLSRLVGSWLSFTQVLRLSQEAGKHLRPIYDRGCCTDALANEAPSFHFMAQPQEIKSILAKSDPNPPSQLLVLSQAAHLHRASGLLCLKRHSEEVLGKLWLRKFVKVR